MLEMAVFKQTDRRTAVRMEFKHRIGQFCAVCFLLSNVQLSSSEDLPGSCIAAGYTTCCDSEEHPELCAGDTGSCFCDPSCREFNDCCSDLDDICPREDLFYPLTIFISRISFHSATLRWATAHVNSSFSHTYLVSYSALSASTASVNSTTVVRIQHGPIGDVYSIDLSGLAPNTTYVANIISTSVYGQTSFEGPTFKTLPYPVVANTHASWFNTTAALVSWDVVTLPESIQLLEYLVYVRHSHMGVEAGELSRWRFSPKFNRGLLTGLSSHAGYILSVTALIKDFDGTVFETSNASKIHIFVPESQLFQLKGSCSIPCSDWNIEIESQVTITLQDSIAAAIRSKCSSPFPSLYITEMSLLCHNIAEVSSFNGVRTTTPTTSYVSFRGKLLSVEECNAESLLELVKAWVVSAPLARIHRESGSDIEIKLIPDSFLRLRLRSEPVCDASAVGETVVEENQTAPQTGCVTVSVFVASLAAELLILLTVFLIGIVITLLVFSRRDRKTQSSEVAFQSSREVPNGGRSNNTNIYTATPTASVISTGATTIRKGEREGEVGLRLSGTAAASGERNAASQQEGEDSLATSELQVPTDQQR